jgi:hypothetical protein
MTTEDKYTKYCLHGEEQNKELLSGQRNSELDILCDYSINQSDKFIEFYDTRLSLD